MAAVVLFLILGLVRALQKKGAVLYLVFAFICFVLLVIIIAVLPKNAVLPKIPDIQEIEPFLGQMTGVAGIAAAVAAGGVGCYRWWKRKKWLDRFFNIYRPSRLKAKNVGVINYTQNEYIPLYDQTSFSDALRANQNLILLGQTQNGKSRAVYEELILLRDNEYVILMPSSLISNVAYNDALEKAKKWLSARKVIIVLDDVDKFVRDGLALDSFFDDVKSCCDHANVQLVMTLRNEVAATVLPSEEYPGERCVAAAKHIELRLLTDQEGRRLMPKGPLPEYYDRTPGSLNKEVIERVNYFNGSLSLNAQKCYYIVQRFYNLNVIPVPYTTVKELAAAHEIDGADCDKCFSGLIDKRYILRSGQSISPQSDYEAKILNTAPPLGIDIDDNEIVNLLLSEEKYYINANKAANKLRSDGKRDLSWRIFSVTLEKVTSKNPQDYVAGAMVWEKNGNLLKAVEMLQAGIAENFSGGSQAIATKLGEIYSRQNKVTEAIEVLSKGFSGDKVVLRNLATQVMKKYGAYAALMLLEDKIDLLNGRNDQYIKSSVHAMYGGNEQIASEEFQNWIVVYKSEFDIIQKPLNRNQGHTWNKRLSLAAMILRVYSDCCANIVFFRENARFLTHNFQEASIKHIDLYSAQYHVAQRYFDNSFALLNREELV
ncbi:MAG: hypothetical protein FWE49_07035, partial [Synergistaceae bacterium]|nr:hypothetical protein [Synergistaceae bacterium]